MKKVAIILSIASLALLASCGKDVTKVETTGSATVEATQSGVTVTDTTTTDETTTTTTTNVEGTDTVEVEMNEGTVTVDDNTVEITN